MVVPKRMTGRTPTLSAIRPIGHRLAAPKMNRNVVAKENWVRVQPNSRVIGIMTKVSALYGRMLVANVCPTRIAVAILILRGEKSLSTTCWGSVKLSVSGTGVMTQWIVTVPFLLSSF